MFRNLVLIRQACRRSWLPAPLLQMVQGVGESTQEVPRDIGHSLFRGKKLYSSISVGKANNWSILRSYYASSIPGGTVDVLLAQTGEGIKECELIQWHVQEGDSVAEFDQVCEVQSDKAAVEITSQYTGVIRKLLHEPGDMVQVGDALLRMEVEEEEGDDMLASATADNTMAEVLVSEEEQVGTSGSCKGVLASPAVRSIAREHGIDLETVPGSGNDGRISKADILEAIQRRAAAPGERAAQVDTEESLQAIMEQGPLDTPLQDDTFSEYLPSVSDGLSDAQLKGTVGEPLRGYRRAMVQSMTTAAAVPHFHFMDEVEMAALVKLKKDLEGDFAERYNIKLTYLPFILKAVSEALHDWPEINSTLSSDGKVLLRHTEHNLGVAMATPKGLVVPNIKSVQKLTLLEVAREVQRLSADARAGRLRQEDISGGTLTVSNIGAIGGIYATPIIFPPEVAIVALGRVRDVAQDAVNDDERHNGPVEMVPKMAVSWGADHRVVDGATLANFSNTWKSYLESTSGLFRAVSQ